MATGAAAHIENPASYGKTNQKPLHLERGPAETVFLTRDRGVWEIRRTARVQVFSCGRGVDAAAGSLLADSLEHGRVWGGLGQRILALHCGEIMAVQRRGVDYAVRPVIAAPDAERIVAALRSADLVANICHKFFVPAGEKQADHRGRARYISALGGAMVVAAWNANANQKIKATMRYACAFRHGVEVHGRIISHSQSAAFVCYF
jgi:hypothetical protein